MGGDEIVYSLYESAIHNVRVENLPEIINESVLYSVCSSRLQGYAAYCSQDTVLREKTVQHRTLPRRS